MSKFLRDLLDAEEPIFSHALKDLEQASGRSGVDVRLIADITHQTHAAIRELGLTSGVTGSELYYSLLGRIARDNERIAKLVGGDDPDDVRHIVPFLVEAANKVSFNRKVFVLKHEKAKEFLRHMPPKNLIKHLGCKNIEQLLKQENFSELYTALRFSEESDWSNAYNELFKTVTADDYEERDIEIIIMDHDKYVDLAEDFVKRKSHNVTHTKEMGVIAVMPIRAKTWKGLALKTLPLLLHYMNEVKLYSTFFKLKSKTIKHFGEVVMETLTADTAAGSQLVGQHIHWRVIQRYFGKLKDRSHPEAFEPHIQPMDLHWRRAEELLYEIDPAMEFWKDRDWVGYSFESKVVSLNLIDVALSYSNGAEFDNRLIYHFRESLWNEIFARYMSMPNLQDQVLQGLNNDMVAPEKLRSPLSTAGHSRLIANLKHKDKAHNLLVRQNLIDAAEGRLDDAIDDFEKAFEILEKYEKTVTIFGSARLSQDDPICKHAYRLGKRFAMEGYAVVTGGGHGVMEAANHGAYDAGGASIGMNIQLPKEQTTNEYTTVNYQFDHFFSRKVTLTLDASAYIFMSGGFGTLDELLEVLVLEQTNLMPKAPVILVGTDVWKPFDRYVRTMLDEHLHTIKPVDADIYVILDNIDDIVKCVNEYKNDSSAG
jgi:hypothetical protein